MLTMSSYSPVDRAPARCLRGLGFNTRRDSDFFFVSHAREIAILQVKAILVAMATKILELET